MIIRGISGYDLFRAASCIVLYNLMKKSQGKNEFVLKIRGGTNLHFGKLIETVLFIRNKRQTTMLIVGKNAEKCRRNVLTFANT